MKNSFLYLLIVIILFSFIISSNGETIENINSPMIDQQIYNNQFIDTIITKNYKDAFDKISPDCKITRDSTYTLFDRFNSLLNNPENRGGYKSMISAWNIHTNTWDNTYTIRIDKSKLTYYVYFLTLKTAKYNDSYIIKDIELSDGTYYTTRPAIEYTKERILLDVELEDEINLILFLSSNGVKYAIPSSFDIITEMKISDDKFIIIENNDTKYIHDIKDNTNVKNYKDILSKYNNYKRNIGSKKI